jgi:hypothetical protein
VTVELAAAIPLLAVFTVAFAGVVMLGSDQVTAVAAAREGARQAAISGDPARAVASARGALLDRDRDAEVLVDQLAADEVRVRVRIPVRLLPGNRLIVTGTAVAAVEPGQTAQPTSTRTPTVRRAKP